MASRFTQLPTSPSTSNLLTYGSNRVGSPMPGLSKPSSSEKFSLPPSPATWGTPLLMNVPEPDDDLHNPDPQRDTKSDKGGTIMTARGIANLGCLFILVAGMTALLFSVDITLHGKKSKLIKGGSIWEGSTPRVKSPRSLVNWALIDQHTPQDVYVKKSYRNPDEDLVLVFSDEFDQDGRTFYPGDDPFWEAVDLHYWGTNDLEWYDPQQVTTEGGALRLKLSPAEPEDNHNLSYRSGMIQSWNKFCFTGGLIEANVMLPGSNDVIGLWPAIWTMGNLGRAGFGGSLEGLWPYSYDACDVGTLPNQTYPGTSLPEAATVNGDPVADGALSYLPGQRLSACTCPGEAHPGPMRPDGSYVGRAAPEIDIFEALVDNGVGRVSMSAQWAPFNHEYKWLNTSENLIIPDPDRTQLNAYAGGAYQQTTSCLSTTNQTCYEQNGQGYAVYGFEYKPGFDDAYITWFNEGTVAWTMLAPGMDHDPSVEISARQIPVEPMYIIANLGFSLNFGGIDFDNLVLPVTMAVDYIRVYQRRDSINVGCDPQEFPTKDYIDAYIGSYTNANFTTWEQFGQPLPKNRLMGGC